MRVAEYQAIAGVPQHEGFRNGFDRIAQPQVSFYRLLGEALLFGDVDGDTDQVHAGVAGALAQLATDTQPNPVPAGVLHAEGLVDVVDFRGNELIGDREQVDVVGLHERVDFAECQKVAAGLEPQHREHRLRPEDSAARQVPIPQSATTAVERGIDTPAHGVVDEVALTRARRLPVKCEAEDQYDETGGGKQRHRQGGVRLPKRIDLFLDDDELTGQRFDDALDRQRAAAVRQGDVGDASLLSRCGERQRGAKDVENAAVRAGDDNMSAGRDAPGRNEAGQQKLQALERCGALLPNGCDAVDTFGEKIGKRDRKSTRLN